jgi:hypothetical protein
MLQVHTHGEAVKKLAIVTAASAMSLAVSAAAQSVGTQDRICKSGVKLDAFEVWKGVRGRDDAARFLRHHYARIGSAEGLANWLRCQGFRATLSPGPFGTVLRNEWILQAGFILEEHGGRALWRQSFLPWPPTYAQNFRMIFDPSGKIRELGIGRTVE